MIIKYLLMVALPYNNCQRFAFALQVSCELLGAFILGIMDNHCKTVVVLQLFICAFFTIKVFESSYLPFKIPKSQDE